MAPGGSVGGRPAGRLPALRAHLARRRATASEFEALSAALTLAPGEGLPGRVLVSGRAHVARRCAPGRELPACRGGAQQRAARRLRASRCAPRAASWASWSSSPASCASPTSGCWPRWTRSAARSASSWPAAGPPRSVRARESRLRAMLEAALDAVVTMDADRPRDRVEPRRRGDLRLHRERGRRARDGRAHRPAAPARRPPARTGALPADRARRRSSTAGWS